MGDLVTVQCAVGSGDLPLNITWKLNGKNIDLTSDVNFQKQGKRVSILTIDSVNAYHAGLYTCIATNVAGNFSHSAELIVNGLFNNLKSIFQLLLLV